MKRFVFGVLLVAAMLVSQRGSGEQITELPSDSNKPYLTVVGTAGEAKFEALKVAFEKHAGLKEFAAATHFTVIADHTTMYLARYSRDYGRLPAVRLQEADGDVIYEVNGREVPDADQLCDELNSQGATATCVRKKQQYQQREQYQGIDVAPVDKEQPEVKQPKPRRGYSLKTILWCAGGLVLGWLIGVFRYVWIEWSVR